MSTLDEVVMALVQLTEAVENLAEPRGDRPALEHDECCKTIDDAHEHGRELGWWSAFDEVDEMFEVVG